MLKAFFSNKFSSFPKSLTINDLRKAGPRKPLVVNDLRVFEDQQKAQQDGYDNLGQH